MTIKGVAISILSHRHDVKHFYIEKNYKLNRFGYYIMFKIELLLLFKILLCQDFDTLFKQVELAEVNNYKKGNLK